MSVYPCRWLPWSCALFAAFSSTSCNEPSATGYVHWDTRLIWKGLWITLDEPCEEWQVRILWHTLWKPDVELVLHSLFFLFSFSFILSMHACLKAFPVFSKINIVCMLRRMYTPLSPSPTISLVSINYYIVWVRDPDLSPLPSIRHLSMKVFGFELSLSLLMTINLFLCVWRGGGGGGGEGQIKTLLWVRKVYRSHRDEKRKVGF